MIRTRVGYAGGEKLDPSYEDLGDHAETIQMDFDPALTGYAELLEVFWQSHQPTYRSGSSQYRSIIFYHNEEQRRLAEETKTAWESKLGAKLYTEIVPYQNFTRAEGYHQKYQLRNSVLSDAYLRIYPDLTQFVDSTATTRVNGYLGGHGTPQMLESEIDQLGLSESDKELLRQIVSR